MKRLSAAISGTNLETLTSYFRIPVIAIGPCFHRRTKSKIHFV